MKTIAEMFDERAALATRIKEIRDQHKTEDGRAVEFDAETQQNWDRLNKDYDSLCLTIEREERLERFDRDASQTREQNEKVRHIAQKAYDGQAVKAKELAMTASAEDHRESFRAWCMTQIGEELDEKLLRHCKRAAINPHAAHYDFELLKMSDYERFRSQFKREGVELREFQAGTDNIGGATVIAEDFVTTLERSLLAFGGVRQLASVIRTDRGVPLTFPTINDTGTTGLIVAESIDLLDDSSTPFGSTTITIYKYSSRIITVTRELLEDSAVDVAGMMGDLLGERIARAQNAHFTTGTGSGQPSGFVDGLTATEEVSNSAGLTGDNIINLQHDLDPAYRPNARFMAHDTTIAEIRKITVTDQGYIWQPSFTVGDPDRVLGFPIHVNQQMDAWDGSTNHLEIIAFGDFSKYKIVDARGVRMRRLIELYAQDDREGFVAIMRSGGDLLDAGTDPMVVADTGT